MHSDFGALGRTAREHLPVPPVPFDGIRGGLRLARTRARARTATIVALLAVAAVSAQAGIAEKIGGGIRLWLSGGEAAVAVRSFVMVRHPTSADLRRAVAHATFPVVLPLDTPPGSRIVYIAYAPADRPTSITLQYGDAKGDLHLGVSVFDTATVGTGPASLPAGSARPPFHDAYHWQIGRETVLVGKGPAGAASVERIEAAMNHVSPAASLAAVQPALWTSTVLGGVYEPTAVAERLAPASDRTVILDRAHVAAVHALALRRRPILDSHIVALTDIPQVNGEPDYAKATLKWPRTVAVPADGVRAIDAVLRFSGTPRDCRCGVLYDPVGGVTRRIWVLPLESPASSGSAPAYMSVVNPREYAVNVRTLVVTAAR